LLCWRNNKISKTPIRRGRLWLVGNEIRKNSQDILKNTDSLACVLGKDEIRKKSIEIGINKDCNACKRRKLQKQRLDVVIRPKGNEIRRNSQEVHQNTGFLACVLVMDEICVSRLALK
jgi:hypothetical protein